MENVEITEQHADLCRRIFSILSKKGPSQTTMDLLARELSISKRTLYEIFGSKDEMMRILLDKLHQEHAEEVERLIHGSSNVMEAMAQILSYHQRIMLQFSAQFFRDMEDRARQFREKYDCNSRKWSDYMSKVISLGIRQGVFRDDVDYPATLYLIQVQMESLKRMEDNFPPEISMTQAYNAIALGTLRSIATPKGMETLDQLAYKFK